MTDRQTDRQTDIRTDGRPGKNNMSPNPSGGDINQKYENINNLNVVPIALDREMVHS